MATASLTIAGLIAALVSGGPLAMAASYGGSLATAHSKIALLESDRVPHGGVVVLTATELTAYAREQAEVIAPGAIHDLHVILSNSEALTSASIDFLRVRQAEGNKDNWLVRKFLEGERPVRILARFQSSHGRARVDVERVEISGVAVGGDTLDFLLRQIVIPNFPEARVGAWFRLAHHIDHFDVADGRVRLVVK